MMNVICPNVGGVQPNASYRSSVVLVYWQYGHLHVKRGDFHQMVIDRNSKVIGWHTIAFLDDKVAADINRFERNSAFYHICKCVFCIARHTGNVQQILDLVLLFPACSSGCQVRTCSCRNEAFLLLRVVLPVLLLILLLCNSICMLDC